MAPSSEMPPPCSSVWHFTLYTWNLLPTARHTVGDIRQRGKFKEQYSGCVTPPPPPVTPHTRQPSTPHKEC
ncbi:hypothetical protein E2C01_039480 [Portunus trituberculatus]|uniref:Uncharacterized protein n=1 Tax=Portunus trituberculatus TaxID=210409 RepID=A0A5B7FN57_PORTR|nr:hypothetical protein [Portunus trituberculatus]